MSSALTAFAHDRRIAEALLEISNAVGSVMEIDVIFDRICNIGARVMETQTCSIYMRDDEDPSFLVLRATFGLSTSQELGIRGFPFGAGLPGWAAINNQTLALADSRNDPRNHRLDDTEKEQTSLIAFMATPIRVQDKVVGVMTVRRVIVHQWTPEEVVFAEIIAKQIAIVWEKAVLYSDKVSAERLGAVALSLSEVAHYIKNILQSMSGGAFFVDTGLKRGDLDQARKGWDMLRRSNEKIRTLVENMLTFSRERRSNLEEGDITELIVGLAEEIEETAFKRKMALRLDLDENAPKMMFDSEAIHDALLNLVTNAMDAIPKDHSGLIEIRTEWLNDQGKLVISVKDNGTGIPPDVQKRLFNLFFTTKGRGGTGIGLAVTRKIIGEHGGMIRYTTEQGVGTTFIIELPVS
ncbi:GAF domain-containing protein [Candidatus Sumerlaeota bacterium]|nr:GAF domain-containing protein [Candidatus Sumerlaeota bacterium]